MDQTLVNVLLALITVSLLHNIIEVSNVRRKVARLSAYINKKPYEEMKLSINTRPKAYGLATASFIILTGLSFGALSLINLNDNAALWYGVVILVLAYFSLAVLLDKYHIEIERVTRPFMKK